MDPAPLNRHVVSQMVFMKNRGIRCNFKKNWAEGLLFNLLIINELEWWQFFLDSFQQHIFLNSLSASDVTVVVSGVFKLLLLLRWKQPPLLHAPCISCTQRDLGPQSNTSYPANHFESTCTASCRPTQKARNGCFWPASTHVSVHPLFSKELNRRYVASAHSYPSTGATASAACWLPWDILQTICYALDHEEEV